jgi:signal transduction histidine kinase
MSRRLLVGYVALAVFVLALLEVPLGLTYAHNERQDLASKVEQDAVAVASLVEGSLERAPSAVPAGVSKLARSYAASTGGRVLVVDRRGVALLDTARPGPAGGSFVSRPEITRALAGGFANGVRTSHTLHEQLLYVAVPVASNGAVHGAVRITYPTSAVDRRVRRYWLTLAGIAGVVLGCAILIGAGLARSFSRPLRKLEAAADAAGGGDLSVRAPDEGPPEMRALASTFNDMVGKLAAARDSQRAFVADASHQLRTPLTALRLRLENLERDASPSDARELAVALAEVGRLSALVDGLLALARADAGGRLVENVDVSAGVRARCGAWEAVAAARDVTVAERAADGLAARATPGHLEQVLDNLLANALEASPDGGTISVAALRAGPWIEIRVADEGPGMSAAERERAFDRFWQGRRRTGGSGLGLAIARRLVESDGGELTLGTAARGGVEATVRVRAARPGATSDRDKARMGVLA